MESSLSSRWSESHRQWEGVHGVDHGPDQHCPRPPPRPPAPTAPLVLFPVSQQAVASPSSPCLFFRLKQIQHSLCFTVSLKTPLASFS